MTDLGLNTDTNVQVLKEHSGRMENPDRTSFELSDRELHQLYAGLVLFFGTSLTITFIVFTQDILCGAIFEGGACLLAWVVATQPSSKD